MRGGPGLGPVGGIAMHHTRFYRLVHGGCVGGGSGLGRGGIPTLDGGIELFVQRLDTGLGRLVTDSQAHRFAGGFDCGFGIGHDRMRVGAGQRLKRPGESQRFFLGRHSLRMSMAASSLAFILMIFSPDTLPLRIIGLQLPV